MNKTTKIRGFCRFRNLMISKKAFITHPIFLSFCAFILGMVVMYLIAKGTIPIPIPVC